MFGKRHDGWRPAEWPYRLRDSLPQEHVEAIRRRVDELANQAQYGWGHTTRFGPFTKHGVLGENYLEIAGRLKALGWWPSTMAGLRVADIGCFTGGLSLLLAHEGAARVLAVDEVADHLAQCRYLCGVFGVETVEAIEASLYELPERVAPGSLDVVLLSGVLYHLSDMLVGLLAIRDLLKVGGVLLLESNVVDDSEHSYANFGRFAMGMWWQPSTLCLRDMCEFMGLSEVELCMWRPDRCLARAVKRTDDPIPYRRGMNYHFADLKDAQPRPPDLSPMAPR